MAKNFNITVTGVKEIDDCLNKMPLVLTERVLQLAGVAASKVLVEKARLLAPEGPTGNLVDSIGAVKSSFNKVATLLRDVGEVTVGPRRGGIGGGGRYKGNAGHLVEYGTRPRRTKGRSKGRKRIIKNANRGVMPKKPFMEPAFQATKDQVLSQYNAQVGKQLVNVMKRTLKK